MKAVSAPSVAFAVVVMMAGITHGASAQHYDGCFVNGQQVADSLCQGGGGSPSSMMSNPMYGNLMSMSRQLGGAMVKSLMAPPPQRDAPADNGAATAAAEQERLRQLKAQQDQHFAADRAAADAAAQQEKRQFDAGRQDLLGEIHSLGGAPGDGELHVVQKLGAFGAPELKVRAIGGGAAAGRANADIIEPGEVLKDALNNNPPRKPDDGYVPSPVARLDNVDPRSYPRLKSFTDAQNDAHALNDYGVNLAEGHDWRNAWGAFAAAYDRDPAGPFSKVIRDNMEIAARHLDQSRPQASGTTAPGRSSTSSSMNLNPHMVAATSPPPAAPPRTVLPKTYGECNAEFQTQTRTCQRADGSWDRAGCFDPAYVRLTACIKGLTAASAH
jgi:hypothetical protein